MSVLTAVRKMIGVVRLRSRPRMNFAVSKPSIPGIWTSSRTTAKSSSSSALSASSPDPAAPQVDLQRLEHRRQREQVLRAVVDEQDARRVVYRCSHTRMRESSWSTSTGLVM